MVERHQLIVLVIIIVSLVQSSLESDCECICRQLRSTRAGDVAICDFLENLNNAVEANKGDLMKWNRHFSFVKKFSENWKEEIGRVVEEKTEAKDGQDNRQGNGNGRRNKKLDYKLVGSTEIPVTTKAENTIPLLERRLGALEARTVHLEEELVREKKFRRKIESNVVVTNATLIAVTNEILNLTSSVDAITRMLYSYYPFFFKALNAKFSDSVREMNADIQILRQRIFGKSNEMRVEEEPMDEDIISRLHALEGDVKGLNSSVADVLAKCTRWYKSWKPWKRTTTKEIMPRR